MMQYGYPVHNDILDYYRSDEFSRLATMRNPLGYCGHIIEIMDNANVG